MNDRWNIIIVGAGTCGMAAAIFASRRNAKVLLLEGSGDIGGTLHISGGMMSAAGTKLQAKLGIKDSPQEHYDDVMRICRNTADPAVVRLAVDHAAATFDWLTDLGLPLVPQSPALTAGAHEPYTVRRYSWCPEFGRSVLKTIAPSFQAAVATGNVTLKLRTKVTGLIQDPRTRAILGVRTEGADGAAEYLGSNIVLATGGYGANGAMMAEFHGTPLYAMGAPVEAQGSGLNLGRSVGGFLKGAELYHGNFGTVLADYNYPSKIIGRALTMPEVRQPWEVYVDSEGNRFVREDESSVDERERALIGLPDRRYWIVFDSAILKDAPPVMEFWSREQIEAALGHHPMFLRADTIEELARQGGMNAEKLARSIAAYNGALNGNDPLGRKHRPRPITKGPYYAIRQHCTTLVGTVGLAVDGQLRVIDRNLKPIQNLYAAGELLGSWATMGDSAANGMMVTPALTFGRILGERLLQWDSRRAAAE
ncbi:MAG: FAD-dependent oxidoreductase [Alphaproteobacteria bacterium]|nr:FAD-dependent oxidoreductase [Alphaproteobacteria bacterium]